ncbi:MAG TPA: hypothetical protein VEX62_01050 [Candidatus Limnocylindrales bacterium]|nr:hypothetical protein [Candidatus Limnocylindrales bacterium]
MHRVGRIIAVTLVLLCASAGTAAGHFGAQSFVFVTDDAIDPGEQFTLIGSDLAPDSEVEVNLRIDEYAATLGTLRSGSDGHFETLLTMPAEAPSGFIELIASSPDGTSASAWIHVGPRTGQEAPPPTQSQSAFPIDPSLIVLGVLLAGSVGAVAYMLLRRRPAAGPTTVATRRVPSKRGRRTRG